ncbi:MAG: hypothetical protein AABY22_28965 [Nanoarchaeota archaeon]
MNNEEIKKFLGKFKNLKFYYKNYTCKTDAVNDEVSNRNFDILITASDDLYPTVKNYDNIVYNDMMQYFPNLDGCLNYNLSIKKNRIRVSYQGIMGINLYKIFGYIVNPLYKNIYGDHDIHRIVTRLNKTQFINKNIFIHRFNKNDNLIKENAIKWTEHDRKTYEQREKQGFPIP